MEQEPRNFFVHKRIPASPYHMHTPFACTLIAIEPSNRTGVRAQASDYCAIMFGAMPEKHSIYSYACD